MQPEREEELLELAQALADKVAGARIPLVEDPDGPADGVGVPPSCVGNVATFLERGRDLERLREFVDRLDRLDRLTGQNLENPRAHHWALRRILGPWLDEHRDLSARECLYVLSWVRRLVPVSQAGTGKPRSGMGPRPGRPKVEPERRQSPQGEGFGQMARALEKLKKGS